MTQSEEPLPDTISAHEVGMILGLAAARDQRTIGDVDIYAWHADLNEARLTYADADQALTQFYGVDQPAMPREHRYRVTAADVIATAKKIRAQRLKNFGYQPPPTDDDDPEYIPRYRGQLGAVASGMVPPPAIAELLAGEPHKALAAITGGVGQHIPKPDPDGDLIATVRRAGPLGVECPICHAAIGRPCRRGQLGKPRRMSHPERLTLSAGKPPPTPEQQAAADHELERRLAYSRAQAEAEPSTFVPPGRGEKP
jgi:hypothetical protein